VTKRRKYQGIKLTHLKKNGTKGFKKEGKEAINDLLNQDHNQRW
jgi:hypothetical protein